MTYQNLSTMCRRWLAILWIGALAGCSSVTNPVANGVPARLLPDELLAESVEAMEPTPLAWLRVRPPEEYRLDTGDIIGAYIEGALGDRDQLPPINFPEIGNLAPSFGFPIPVGEGGTVLLPLVKKVKVAGLTLEEAQEEINKAYTQGEKEYLKAEESSILVTLVRPRQARILVIREDAPSTRPSVNDTNYRLFGSAPSLGIRSQGTGTILELAETEADVLSALAETGGLPGPTAANEVVIYRGFSHVDGLQAPLDWNGKQQPAASDEPTTTRIPLRVKPGEPRPFTESDIQLRSGDIVFIPPRDTDVYYTGGLLPAREVPLPRDNDLRVVEAILRVGGSVVSGGALVGNFGGASGAYLTGIENSNPSLLTVIRRTPGNGQVVVRVDLNRALRDPRENLMVMPGDLLVLQETPAESVSRYVSSVVNFGIISEIFRRGSAAGTVSTTLP